MAKKKSKAAAFKVMGSQAKHALQSFWGTSGWWLRAMLAVVIPICLILFGEWVYSVRGFWGFGGELFAALVIGLFYMGYRWFDHVYGMQGLDIPIPKKPFVEHDVRNGMVTIEHSRLEELILYVDELEDWFAKNGYYDIVENASKKDQDQA